MAKRDEGAPPCVLVMTTLLVVVLLAAQAKSAMAASYNYTSDMKSTVWGEVKAAIDRDEQRGIVGGGVGAALIRLLFHDCWVKGCDGSVLLNSTPYNGTRGTEKNASSNIGLRGFEVIDAIKTKLGDNVSCADIVVFAAREATIILSRGKINYTVEAGRMDGVNSSAEYADAILPPPTFNFTQLKQNFAAKNFTQEELVVLSGAHAVGVAHYSSFKDRLDPLTATPINATYQLALGAHLVKLRSQNLTQTDPTVENNIRDMDDEFRKTSLYNDAGVDTTPAARGTLDNSYYHANLQNMVLFRSDWELRNDTTGAAGRNMQEFKDNAAKWYLLFGNAMAKLSELPPEGNHSEIRKDCKITN